MFAFSQWCGSVGCLDLLIASVYDWKGLLNCTRFYFDFFRKFLEALLEIGGGKLWCNIVAN
jgi:hypothetical protein